MKKALNITFIFIFLVSLFSGAFFINEENEIEVEAAEGCYNSKTAMTNGECVNSEENGSVTLTKEGQITIKYNYGFSELLIYAEGCTKYTDDTKSECAEFGNKHIIHVSGDYAKSGQKNEKQVHLFKYFDYDVIARVSMIYRFASSNDNGEKNVNAIGYTGFYRPLYCNVDSGIPNCGTGQTVAQQRELLVSKRIKAFATTQEGLATGSYLTSYYDKKQLVYNANTGINNSFSLGGEKNGVNQAVLVKIDNTTVGGATSDIESMIYDTIIPVLWVLLGVCAVVSCTVLGYQIVKSADEAQERQDKIKSLRNILIGLAMAAIVLFAAEPVINFINKYLE